MSTETPADASSPTSSLHDVAPRDAEPAAREVSSTGPSPAPPTMLGNLAAAMGGGVLQRKLARRALQRREAAGNAAATGSDASLLDEARRGTEGGGGRLPHLDAIQHSF